jgi:2,3-bisphosphoglycerate-independent phosphoglycerate mutase
VSDADPLRADFPVLSVRALEEAPDPAAAERTARVLNGWMRLTHERLAPCDLQLESVGECTLNFMLVKWPGMRTHVTPFRARYGLSGASLGSGPLYRGLAQAVGLEHVAVPIERDPEQDFAGRIATALGLIGSGTTDFVHVHTKWPDSAGHRKDPARKRDVITALDRAIAPLVGVAERAEAVIAVLADHQTPSAGPLYHGGGAVPLLIAGGALGADGVRTYGETACAAGLLGTLCGIDLMPVLLDAADRSAFLADRITATFALGAPRAEDLEPLRTEE